jgi:hypothetical protein
MSALLQGISERQRSVNGTLYISDGVQVPDHFENGLPYEVDSTLATTLEAPDHYHQGLGFSAEGRLCRVEATPDYFGSGAAPLVAGSLCMVVDGVIDHYNSGVAYTADGALAVLSGVIIEFGAQWTIGNNTTRWGYSQGNYGALEPDFVQGTQVDTFRTATGDLVKVDMQGGVQIPSLGDGSVDMYFEGYPNNPVLFQWDIAESYYSSGTDLVLEQWVIDNDGNTVGVEGIPTPFGSDLITNGSFDANMDDWTDSGGAITWNAGGYAQRLAVSTGNLTQTPPGLVPGVMYRVSVTTGDIVGVSTIMLGHTVVNGTTLPEGSGNWVGNVVCGTDNLSFTIRTVNGTYSKIDNISVRAIL